MGEYYEGVFLFWSFRVMTDTFVTVDPADRHQLSTN